MDVMTRFSFFHDRVREAVETLVSPVAAVTLHLTFGRLSMGTVDGLGESATDVQVFQVVGHYVAARELVTDPSEIHHVACLLLEAAKRSVASTSYSEAVSYAEAALEFIGGTERTCFCVAFACAFVPCTPSSRSPRSNAAASACVHA